jgi:dipeptidyl aminopeptidase/acylaminoacyl peptidase
VDHIVRRGVADPARIAILGHSYGGYVALAAIAMTPDRYVCAAASSTTTNLVNFVSRFPRTPGNQWLRDTVGDPELPADAAKLRSVSSITHVDRVSKPVIVARGDRDDAVPPGDLDAFADGVGKRGLSATSIVYEGDGHFYRRANELDYYARVEALLARCLGGRAEPVRPGGEPGATARVRVAGPAASESGKR